MAKKPGEGNELQELKMAIREKAPARLYFFHGEETFLLNHYLGQLQKILIDSLTESFNFHKLTNENFDIQTLLSAVENLPMMAENTMVWVDDVDLFKLPEADRQTAAEILSDIPEYCTVVFTYVTVPWKPDGRMQKLWGAVSTCGRIVEFPKQEPRDLIPWIGRHFAAHKKRITPDLCNYLIEITGGAMTALSSEINKICAYSGADNICKEDIDAVTEPVLDAVIYQMTDGMSRGDYGTALVRLQQLLKMQEKPLYILGAIGSHFRKLGAAKTLLESGKSPGELMRMYRMSEYPAQKTMETARKFSTGFFKMAMELILETDNAIKTSFDDQERLLELLILRLAQEARNG